MLGQRRRQRPNIDPTMGWCLVFAGMKYETPVKRFLNAVSHFPVVCTYAGAVQSFHNFYLAQSVYTYAGGWELTALTELYWCARMRVAVQTFYTSTRSSFTYKRMRAADISRFSPSCCVYTHAGCCADISQCSPSSRVYDTNRAVRPANVTDAS